MLLRIFIILRVILSLEHTRDLTHKHTYTPRTTHPYSQLAFPQQSTRSQTEKQGGRRANREIAILASMAEVTPSQREDFHNNILKGKKNKLGMMIVV